ncbi:EscI/YscI/HrpB family type III secretion system inner rod protein [Pectobacteriaceae bacterium C52]|nr:EscI/YscI/HrpB family type III secretion system inner rod protein [Pectobacteriaceae bacterium C52]
MMKIAHVNEFNGMINDGEPRSLDAPASADVNWFSAALNPISNVMPSADDKSWVNTLVEKSNNLDNLLEHAERQVGKSVSTNNPKDVMDATRTLSSFYLESLMNAKVVAKSVQSLEKLTNLQ